MIIKKKCRICGEEKDIDLFPRRSLNSYRTECKSCTSKLNKESVKKSKAKNPDKYRKLHNEWERNQRLLLSYQIMKKQFITDDEFIFAASQRLLILKRNIKKYENIQRSNTTID